MAPHHVLLLGGHGKIAQFLTPLLLRRSWAVTSIIRNPDQVSAIEKLGNEIESEKGPLNVLVRSLDDVKSEAQAKDIIDEVKPDYIVWSAGAGGKGGAARTYAIDRDAAIHFIRAAAATPSVARFLMVSYLSSRRTQPAWWSAADWAASAKTNQTVLANYYEAKLAADEVLYEVSKQRGPAFVGINLRPGTLSLEPAGRVELGKTKGSGGEVSRESVARVADELLASEGVRNAWLDLLDGEEEIGEAVGRVVREGVDAAEGEAIF
ncbi:hypothetical protein B0T25DRAFT_624944 [Lasiosphaeria hispida]|uniref:NAD(P)-binding domain-containing protein n=1 Tax=Lasiosphaeria hispida TaxID=260671 RepID=A0AAJ0HBJ4_9PEZI|nr:hypothetical protein B0T25DRAFT_624944 [Lasiosphaeria hispida]